MPEFADPYSDGFAAIAKLFERDSASGKLRQHESGWFPEDIAGPKTRLKHRDLHVHEEVDGRQTGCKETTEIVVYARAPLRYGCRLLRKVTRSCEGSQ
jgi:hypothetical protein